MATKVEHKRWAATMDGLWRGQTTLALLAESDATYSAEAKRLARALEKFIEEEIEPLEPK